MKTFDYTIKDELGIHARPAGLLVKEAKKFSSECTITKDGKTKKTDSVNDAYVTWSKERRYGYNLSGR